MHSLCSLGFVQPFSDLLRSLSIFLSVNNKIEICKHFWHQASLKSAKCRPEDVLILTDYWVLKLRFISKVYIAYFEIKVNRTPLKI